MLSLKMSATGQIRRANIVSVRCWQIISVVINKYIFVNIYRYFCCQMMNYI